MLICKHLITEPTSVDVEFQTEFGYVGRSEPGITKLFCTNQDNFGGFSFKDNKMPIPILLEYQVHEECRTCDGCLCFDAKKEEGHEQVSVKVNAFVDKGIAPVISAISELTNVVTFESCENSVNGRAVIYFFSEYGKDDWRGIGEICNIISKALTDFEYAVISVEWQLGSTAYPKGLFEFDLEDSEKIAKAIRNIITIKSFKDYKAE